MVAAKKDGYIHICVDPEYLNKALKGLHYPMTTVEDGASRITSATVFSTLDSINQIRLWVLTTHNLQPSVFSEPFWNDLRFWGLSLCDERAVGWVVLCNHRG